MKNPIKYFIKPKQNISVIHILLDSSKIFFYVADFEIIDKKIFLKNSHQYTDFDKLFQAIPSDQPIIIIITGKGIINKVIYKNQKNQLLSGQNSNEIIVNEFQTDNKIFFSFCRINLADELLKKFEEKSFVVFDMYIGPFVLGTLSVFFENKINIQIDSGLFSFSNGRLDNYKDSVKFELNDLNIQDEKIPNVYILNYATILNYIHPNENYIKQEPNNNAIEDYKYKQLYKKTGLFLIFFIFFMLLTSYFLKNEYQNKNNTLTGKIERLKNDYNQIISIEKNIFSKKQILSKSGINRNEFISFYINRLLINIPNEIILQNLNLFPVNKVEYNKPVNINNNIILIKGSTFHSKSLNQWIKALQNEKWIDKVRILKFKTEQNRRQEFELEINIKVL